MKNQNITKLDFAKPSEDSDTMNVSKICILISKTETNKKLVITFHRNDIPCMLKLKP